MKRNWIYLYRGLRDKNVNYYYYYSTELVPGCDAISCKLTSFDPPTEIFLFSKRSINKRIWYKISQNAYENVPIGKFLEEDEVKRGKFQLVGQMTLVCMILRHNQEQAQCYNNNNNNNNNLHFYRADLYINIFSCPSQYC